jgi:hypothetical protein
VRGRSAGRQPPPHHCSFGEHGDPANSRPLFNVPSVGWFAVVAVAALSRSGSRNGPAHPARRRWRCTRASNPQDDGDEAHDASADNRKLEQRRQRLRVAGLFGGLRKFTISCRWQCALTAPAFHMRGGGSAPRGGTGTTRSLNRLTSSLKRVLHAPFSYRPTARISIQSNNSSQDSNHSYAK